MNEQLTLSAGFMSEEDILKEAQAIYDRRMRKTDVLENPSSAIEYLKARLGDRDREVFAVLHLNTRHYVIEYEELFLGTIDGAVVHPRIVVRSALLKNSAAMIICHNHPSQIAEPSQSDIALTHRLRDALDLVDVRLLDHIIVGGNDHVSLSRRGNL